MVTRTAHPLLRFIRNLGPRADGAPDEDLLARFVAGDQTAFAALIQRHGAMVLGVCARLLGDTPDAEDAFQAVFVVLARRARSVSRPGLLGNWLYGVAYRTALKIRSATVRRREVENQVSRLAETNPLDEVLRRDLRRTLDDELSRLPEKYRTPLVLCYLEGQTHEEAARRLGCPRKTITTRLTRGCERLRGRLARHGVALSSAALATVLSDDLRAMPPALLEKTFHLIAAGPVPASITAIAKEVLMSMYISKLTGTAALVLLTGMFGALAAALALAAPVEERSKDKKPPLQRPAAPAEAAGKKDGDALQGAWEAQSAEQDGKALPEAEIKKMRVSIKGDLMLMLPGGEWTRLRIKLDPAKTPKVMYATPIEGDEKDKTVPLIYRLDTAADTLTLCFDAKNGKTAPAEFAAREGSGLMLLVVKREARAPAAAKE